MESLVTNKEILDNLLDRELVLTPILGGNDLYNIVYKTTCTVTGKVYVGVHSTKKLRDGYLGCGVDSDYSSELSLNYGLGTLVGQIKRFGTESFIREDLVYCYSVDEALEIEKIIVDRSWVKDVRTLNQRVGGYRPPRLIGDKNGNYKNTWSEKKRREENSQRRD